MRSGIAAANRNAADGHPKGRSEAEEARERLDHLQEHGPTPFAFTFKARFEQPDAEWLVVDDELGCPA